MLVGELKVLFIARLMLRPIFGFGAWAAVVVVLHTLAHAPERWGLAPGIPARVVAALHWSDVGIPFSAIAALGSALAIFLGFRNNSAYDRWWEARKIWGALVNDSRSWCRQVLSYVESGGPDDDVNVKRVRVSLVHRHLAFVHALAHHLRGQRAQAEAVLVRYLDDADEAARLNTTPNVVSAVLMEQGRQLRAQKAAGRIDGFEHLSMDRLLSNLSDIQGKCERIKNTPLPRQYDVLPRWVAYIYSAMLPLGLVQPLGWACLPVSVTITLIFLALEASGRAIEDPFENAPMDTPMTALSFTIERDLRAALEEPLPPAAVADASGVLM